MIRQQKHIAIFLFGIFFFSITFQTLHIVWHHSHGYHDKHFVTLPETSNKFSLSNAATLSQKEEVCPICEYRFSINDLPQFPIYRSFVPVFACSFNEIATKQQYKHTFPVKSPRAPPVFIS